MLRHLYISVLLSLSIITVRAQTTAFGCSGAGQNYVVPAGVTCLDYVVQGAQGGGVNGGLGARVTGTLTVTPGQTIRVYVGCRPGGMAAGYNGGGSGQNATSAGDPSYGGGGGSDLRISPYTINDRVVVAGGGGGTGGGTEDGAGGIGGCAAGAAGAAPFGIGGLGGTQTAGGTGGNPWISSGNTGFDGSFFSGGNGATDPCYNNSPGGGGGGGYYGGGGGGSDCYSSSPYGGGGGGGGSSLVPAGAVCTAGVKSGQGRVTLTPSTGCVLPIVLVSFTGENAGSQNKLTWVTASEINNAYFMVERSPDGIEPYEEVGTKDGAGNSNSMRTYELMDPHPLPTITYYRLKQVDFDGKYSYSDIVPLTSPEIIDPYVYPNPTNEGLTIAFGKVTDAKVTIKNALGQVVLDREVLSDDHLKVKLPGATGIYFLQIEIEGKLTTKKIFKK